MKIENNCALELICGVWSLPRAAAPAARARAPSAAGLTTRRGNRGFLLVLLETLFVCLGSRMTYFSSIKGSVCAVSSFCLGMLLDIIPAKCGTSLFTL